jgi:hypothetical protein
MKSPQMRTNRLTIRQLSQRTRTLHHSHRVSLSPSPSSGCGRSRPKNAPPPTDEATLGKPSRWQELLLIRLLTFLISPLSGPLHQHLLWCRFAPDVRRVPRSNLKPSLPTLCLCLRLYSLPSSHKCFSRGNVSSACCRSFLILS